MLDARGNTVEVGDEVTFPGPYGQTLVIGKVVRVWDRTRYGSRYRCVRVRPETPLNGEAHRDCYATYAFQRANGEHRQDEINYHIVIIRKGLDNSTN